MPDTNHIKQVQDARAKYKPEVITCLFIAEAPPSSPDRFFYFEEVREQDSLYLEMMKALFPEEGKTITLEDEYSGQSVHRFRSKVYSLIWNRFAM